jgi:hypothetical protein
MLCNGQLNDDIIIYTVTALRLRYFHDKSDKFPSGFLQKFINLKNLKVTYSSFTYIFSSGRECAGHSKTFMKLRSLVLIKLDNLEFATNSSKYWNFGWTYRCSRLKNVIRPSGQFENLEQLLVSNCGGLENIFKSSIINKNLENYAMIVVKR